MEICLCTTSVGEASQLILLTALSKHRATTRPFFTRSRLSLDKILEPHTSKYISAIKRFFPARENVPRPFDVQELIRRLTLDVAMSWFCGHSTDLLDDPMESLDHMDVKRDGKPEGVRVFEAFAEAQVRDIADERGT